MKKIFLCLILTFNLVFISCCDNSSFERSTNSATIHMYAVQTDYGRAYTNTDGKHFWFETSDKFEKKQFGENITDISHSNGIVYFIDRVEYNSDTWTLCKFEKEQITEITKAEKYKVIGSSIYYVHKNSLYLLDISKNEPTKIISNFPALEFDVDSKYIYWVQEEASIIEQNIYRSDKKGNDQKRLTNSGDIDSYNFIVQNGFIYFSKFTANSIFRLDTNGQNEQIVVTGKNGVSTYQFLFNDGWIYYDYGQKRIKSDGTENQNLFDLNNHKMLAMDLAHFDIDDKYMYFANTLEDTETSLIRIPLEEILSGNIKTIKLLNPTNDLKDYDTGWILLD